MRVLYIASLQCHRESYRASENIPHTLLCLKSGNYIWKSYHIKLSFIVLLFWLTLQCNKKRIIDYPNIWGYLRDLYQTSGIGETVDAEHIQKHYQVGDIPFLPFFFFVGYGYEEDVRRLDFFFFCFLSIFQFFPKFEQLNTGCSLSASVYGNNL